MKINANFDQRVVVHSGSEPWLDSPMPGVQRRPLDRVGGELARATSVVRYAPGSEFSPHVHTGGEEFLVIDGVFQDEHGDFPKGSYLRNPPESKHKPGSEPGCTILVKLWQFDPQDRTHVRLQTQDMQAEVSTGVGVVPLHQDEHEQVSLQFWQANQIVELDAKHGVEVFVLDGSFVEAGELLVEQSWLRLPLNRLLRAQAGPEGAKVWLKQNHLRNVAEQIKRVQSQS